jgi:uracil-DNA glycosylase
MGDFLRAEIAAGRRYLPAGENVLRAFKQPFADVRVLIMGQDPYPAPGCAVGLSFSVPPELRRLPPSLVNIFNEYTADLGYPQPATGDLSTWAERGVLLLAGPFENQPDEALRGLCVLTTSLDESRAIMAEDPAVVAGRLVAVRDDLGAMMQVGLVGAQAPG